MHWYQRLKLKPLLGAAAVAICAGGFVSYAPWRARTAQRPERTATPTALDGVGNSPRVPDEQRGEDLGMVARDPPPRDAGTSHGVDLPANPTHGDVAPSVPSELRPAAQPTVVLLTAKWCLWCDAFKKKVLSDREVQASLGRFRYLIADVDLSPTWMDLEGVSGLPSLAFFDGDARHVLTLSGYKSVAELEDSLSIVHRRIASGKLTPYAGRKAVEQLPSCAVSVETAQQMLRRFESKIFFAVNSNDGGFGSPARVPHPDLLRELAEWIAVGAPQRVESWVELTIASALQGRSPRLDGKPLPDFAFDLSTIVELATKGSDADDWLDRIGQLPDMDPFQGLQDPVDHGVFRYAVGPGWYNPHFERRALDNLSWAILLKRRGDDRRARQIGRFVDDVFHQGVLLGAVQRANPFYYRLSARERRGVAKPPVDRLWLLEVQARAARFDRTRCHLLRRVSVDTWPRARWTERGEDAESPAALPDAVGELLLALQTCGAGFRDRARQLSDTVVRLWSDGRAPLEGRFARLHRLTSGICEVSPKDCGRALAAIEDLPFDPEYAPPLTALASYDAKHGTVQICGGSPL